jgi:hypothetical protein
VTYLSPQKEDYFIKEAPVVYCLKIEQHDVGTPKNIENIHQILSLRASGWHDEEGTSSGELTLVYKNGEKLENLSLSVIDASYSMQELVGVVGVAWNETTKIDIVYLTTSPDNQEATSNE